MAVYLHETYAKEIQTKFVKESYIAGRFNDSYKFTGVKTVNVSTPITVPMVDYVRSGSNRYGTPTEMQDTVQELTMSQDKSFSLTIDKGNYIDQNYIKAAGKMLALQLSDEAIPLMDNYCFNELANKAGKIVGNTTAISKSNVCQRITDGTTYMNDAEIPSEGRTLFVPAAVYAMLRLSDEFTKADALIEKSLSQGQVGTYDGMAVIQVTKRRWPANVNFIIAHKAAACVPVKLNDTKIHEDPPGISGSLLEGRHYYDLFVFGAKSDGVYVDVDTGSGKGTIVETPTITASTGAITCSTEDAVIYYTTDGSDPRYSKHAKVGSTSDIKEAGTVVKAYATKSGSFPSEVATATLT